MFAFVCMCVYNTYFTYIFFWGGMHILYTLMGNLCTVKWVDLKYIVWWVDKCNPWNQYTNQDKERLHHPEFSLMPPSSLSPLHIGNHCSCFYHHILILPVLELHKIWIRQVVLFLDWFLPHGILCFTFNLALHNKWFPSANFIQQRFMEC